MKWIFLLLCSVTLFAKDPHPVTKVNAWFKEEKERTEGRFFKFASLATVDAEGNPHARMVEVTHFSKKKGALFFTHAQTEKVQHLSLNPHASLNFYLPHTHRQLCVDGVVHSVPQEEAEKAWEQMPRFMKLTFLSSRKGEPLESPEALEIRKKQLQTEYPKDIPCPSTFRGYHLKPERIIFFQVNRRSFPTKEVAHLDKEDWVCTQVEP
ncbi:MAG: pyridoxamine 5'-phosphate oxidase family protein [Chlamydiia bacterium]|nr:pyridoxamine 5'-phosphate oxidase family protein [Chlamydiia bacterium]